MKEFNVKDKRFPKFAGKVELNHNYVDMLDAIKVTTLHAPNLDETRNYAPNWILSTWDKSPQETLKWREGLVDGLNTETVDRLIYRAFQKKFLPILLKYDQKHIKKEKHILYVS